MSLPQGRPRVQSTLADIASGWSPAEHDDRHRREVAEARELGRSLGLISDICEPPPGYPAHQAAAYREGFAAIRSEDVVRADDLFDRLEAAWLEDHFRPEPGRGIRS